MEDLPITLSRCNVFTNEEWDTERPIPVVPKSHDGALNEKQLVDYLHFVVALGLPYSSSTGLASGLPSSSTIQAPH